MSKDLNKKKILIVDANNMFFRAYCASPALNINGQHVGAITGFLYSLQKSIKDVRPHQVFVVWDGEGGSKKRKEIRTDYKDGRKVPKPTRLNRALNIPLDEKEENDSRLYQQSVIIQLLNQLPILQLCEKGVEADDFISYLNHKFDCKDGFLKVIVSNDKDFVQLLDQCTILYRPVTTEFVTLSKAIALNDVHPQNMALARAIEGDQSDNLDGVPGVGMKRLTSLIPEFKNSESITFEKLEELCTQRIKNGKSAKSILESIEKVKQNYTIMQLYLPMVPIQTKLHVDEQIDSFNFEISVSNFNDMLKKEGIIGTSFGEIVKHCESIAKENKK